MFEIKLSDSEKKTLEWLDEDHSLMISWMKQNPKLVDLIMGVKNFDSTYSFSDSSSVWKAGKENENWLLNEIEKVQDVEVKEKLLKGMDYTKLSEFLEDFRNVINVKTYYDPSFSMIDDSKISPRESVLYSTDRDYLDKCVSKLAKLKSLADYGPSRFVASHVWTKSFGHRNGEAPNPKLTVPIKEQLTLLNFEEVTDEWDLTCLCAIGNVYNGDDWLRLEHNATEIYTVRSNKGAKSFTIKK